MYFISCGRRTVMIMDAVNKVIKVHYPEMVYGEDYVNRLKKNNR